MFPALPDSSSSDCKGCGTQVPAGFLICPNCKKLLYSDRLRELATQAEQASGRGDAAAVLAAWRSALELLPAESKQHETIRQKIAELIKNAPQASKTQTEGHRPSWAKKAGWLGALGLLLWKFKVVVIFVATKLKLLLSGITKAGTFFSMLLSFGVYWTAWGWKFALGFVVSIYIHEMGHIASLQKYGIKATMPMFIPGFGAFVRLKQYPATPREDARVGLAGPIWGLGAAVVCYVVFLATRSPIWAAIASTGAWINLFNLLPVWQLDGSRGFRTLTRMHRVLVVMTLGLMWYFTREGLLILLLLFSFFRLFDKQEPETDWIGLLQFVGLICVLSILSRTRPL